MSPILEAEMDKVNNLQSDLDALEEALGQEHIEMYIRQLKMELRCARSLADEQVQIERFFSKISRFLERYLMEHIGIKVSSDSQLQISFIF